MSDLTSSFQRFDQRTRDMERLKKRELQLLERQVIALERIADHLTGTAHE